MEGEEENSPGEGGGGGVGPRTEQIKDCHHQLVSIKLGVVSLTPKQWNTLIGRDPPDTVFSLDEPDYASAKVYAITTHLKAHQWGAICAFRCVVMA